MTFPQTILDSHVDLFYDNQWNEHTSDVRGMTAPDGRVRIVRGRPDEAGQTRATGCALALNNTSNKYSPRNPESSLFGKIGRNTPLRVGVGTEHLAATNDGDTGTAHVAPSVTASKAGLLICAWAATEVLDYTAPASMVERHETDGDFATMSSATEALTAGGATGTRTATASSGSGWTTASMVAHGVSVVREESLAGVGTTAAASDVTLTTAAGTLAGWWLVAVQHWDWETIRANRSMPDAPNDGGGGWIELVDSGRIQLVARHHRMRVWARRVSRAGAQAVTFQGMPTTDLDNHAHLYVLSGVDHWTLRASVEVPSFPPRRDTSGNDRWVPVDGAGVLRRLGQGAEPLTSAIRRAVLSPITETRVGTLLGYWPLEDALEASRLASAIPGDPSAQILGTVTPGEDATLAGSQSLPTVGATEESRVRCNVKSTVDNDQWRVEFLFNMTAAPPSGGTLLANVRTDGTGALFQISPGLSAGNVHVRVFDDDDTLLKNTSVADTDFYGGWVHLMLAHESVRAYQLKWRKVGSDTVHNVIDSLAVGAFTGKVRQIEVGTGAPNAVGVSVGHVMVFDNDDNPLQTLHWDADDGYTGEAAGRRIERLCDEQGVTFHPVGDLDDTVPMGPQRILTFPDLLRESETADLGVLYEPREALAIAYRTRASLYNQAATLALTFGATGEVAPPLEPTDDDQLVRNDVTVTRRDATGVGGSARAVDQSGPLGVDTIGRYPDDPGINVPSDLDLPDQAGWRLHLGTVDEYRYPQIRANLAALGNAGKTALLEAAAALDASDLLTIDTLPADISPDTAEQLAQGFTETLAQLEWDVNVNASPASPWTVGVYAGAAEVPAADEPKRYSPTDSRVASLAFDAGTDTALVVEDGTGGGDLWSTGADTPFDIFVSGARLRVTAVGAATGAQQTLTVQAAAVNGVVKTLPFDAPVVLWQLAVYGL